MDVSYAQTDGQAIETMKLMHKMVDKYYLDMAPYGSWSLPEIFDLIKNLPFRPDPPMDETLMRPRYTLTMQGSGGDCDDKSIALAAYCKLQGLPYRFVSVRRKNMKNLHHVFCQIYIAGKWMHADPTYNFNILGIQREPYAQYMISEPAKVN
jgi:transglutaminase-like putative cysteine protease